MSILLKKLEIFGVAALATTAITANAMMETGGYHREVANVQLIDTNGDNRISEEEFYGFYNTVFEELDTNKDGVLAANEWAGANQEQQVSLTTGGYLRLHGVQKQPLTTKEKFMAQHRAFIEAVNNKAQQGQDPQQWLSRHIGG